MSGNRTRGAAGDVATLLRRLTDQGFTFKKTKKSHYQIFLNGQLITTLGSQSGHWRSIRNAESYLRKAGYTPPR